MKKRVMYSISLLIIIFLGVIVSVYLRQETMLFQSKTLPRDHFFSYTEPFNELFLKTEEGASINALHFYVDNPKGVVVYFRGRGTHLGKNLGSFSKDFTRRGYDLFVMDYRGSGKSRGKRSEKALYHDADSCYNYLKQLFKEENMIVYGRSLGTCMATYVASKHHPKMLILEAPYFSLLDLVPSQVRYVPRFLIPLMLKYPMRTDRWITRVKAPIYIFHGTNDELIPYDSSVRLLKLLPEEKKGSLITIDNGNHNHLRHHPEYQKTLDLLLK